MHEKSLYSMQSPLPDPFEAMEEPKHTPFRGAKFKPKQSLGSISRGIKKEIIRSISLRRLPKMRFRIEVTTKSFKPFIIIYFCGCDKILFKEGEMNSRAIESPDYISDLSRKMVFFNSLGEKIMDELARIIWRYNSDVYDKNQRITTSFLYQFQFTKAFSQSQVRLMKSKGLLRAA